MEEDVREGFSGRQRKEFTGVVQQFSGKMRLLVEFQDGCDNGMTLNQLIVVTVENIPANEEAKVTTISVIPEESIDL